ncbi:sugar-binding protein [Cohnella sp. GCM10027633]|uniref:sugar-binding protein n=1 Tax=unclassified Cohnella TaxID=2636738 RepID=UPI0036262523
MILRSMASIRGTALAVVAALIVGLFAAVAAPAPAAAAGTTYYVDSAAGNDANSGTSTGAPWQTLAKVNAVTFAPGDSILFKTGGIWTGALKPKGSGTATDRITFGRYGDGPSPIINGNGGMRAVHLYNVEYITLRDFEIINDGPTEAVRSGVYIEGQGVNTLDGIYILNNNIHHIKGSSDRDTNMYSNAGILVITSDGAAGTPVANFNDLRLENNLIHDTSTIGIYMNGTNTQWMDYATFSNWNKNVVIRNNYVARTGADSIIAGYCDAPLIEYNTGLDAGVNGNNYKWIASMWSWATNNATFQYNEVGRTRFQSQGSSDSAAFDVDIHTWGTHIFQYNYTHSNAGGIIMTMYNSHANTIYRYNISQNDDHYHWNDTTFTWFSPAEIYNNTIYSNNGQGHRIRNYASSVYKNNIFHVNVPVNYLANPTFSNNLYYGHTAAAADTAAVSADPQFVQGGAGQDGRSTVNGYKLKSTSPAINAGTTIAGNGGKDFWGTTLYNGAPDIGAHEYTATTASVPRFSAAKTSGTVTADGVLSEGVWTSSAKKLATKATLGVPDNEFGYRVAWDDTNLYVALEQKDRAMFNDSVAPSDDDSFDIYIDANNNKGASYDTYDRQYTIRYNDTTLYERNNRKTGVTHGVSASGTTLTAELVVPWSNLGVTPTPGMKIGFDVNSNDDDDGLYRESQSMWAGTANNWTNTSAFGELTLNGLALDAEAATGITVDGNLSEAAWDVTVPVAEALSGTPNNTTTFDVKWDSTYLYVGFKVLDASLFNDSANIWEDDSVDVYIDADYNKGSSYDMFDRQFTIGYNDTSLYERNNRTTGVLHQVTPIAGGFQGEIAIPWSANLGISAAANLVIGIDVANNDDDNGGQRDRQSVWTGTDTNYASTANYGEAVLKP